MGSSGSCASQTTGQLHAARDGSSNCFWRPHKRHSKHTWPASESGLMQQAALERRHHESMAAPEVELDVDAARQHPSRITHGFWLSQYSGLHQREQSSPATPTPSHGHASRASDRTALAGDTSKLATATASSRRNRLLARWTQLVMRRGSSTGELHSVSAGPLSPHPPTSGAVHARGPNHTKRPRTSANTPPAKQHHNQAHTFGCPMCLARTISSSTPSSGSNSPSGSRTSLRAASPMRLSPYKQLARLLGARQGARAEQQVGACGPANSERAGTSRPLEQAAEGEPKAAAKSGANLLAGLFASPSKRLTGLRLVGAAKASSSGGGAVDEQQSRLESEQKSAAAAAAAVASLSDEMQTGAHQRRKRKASSSGSGGGDSAQLSDKLVIGGRGSGGGGGGGGGGAKEEPDGRRETPDKSRVAHESSPIRGARSEKGASKSQSRSSSCSSASAGSPGSKQPAKRLCDQADSKHANTTRELNASADQRSKVAVNEFERGSESIAKTFNRASSFRQKGASKRPSERDESSNVMMADEGENLEEFSKQQALERASSRSIKFATSEQVVVAVQATIAEQQQKQKWQQSSSSGLDEQPEVSENRPLVAGCSSSSASFLPLIRPLASSSSSFNSLLGCLEGASSPNELSASQAIQQSGSQEDVNGGEFCGAPHISLEPTERPVSQPVGSSGGKQTKQGASFKSNFKKFVKRQQSVDSYRMARDLKQKLKRQQEGERNKHQSNEAIKATRSVGDEPAGRKFSMRIGLESGAAASGAGLASGSIKGKCSARVKILHELKGGGGGGESGGESGAGQMPVEICVDPYARPGTFVLPGEQLGGPDAEKNGKQSGSGKSAAANKLKVSPTPPNTLSLAPANLAGSSSSLLMGSGFSGCITPTYPTHHLPSPKYVSPATLLAMQKKYSNASTISSSLACELGASASASANYQLSLGGEQLGVHSNGLMQMSSANSSVTAAVPANTAAAPHAPTQTGQQSDTESSFSITPSGRASRCEEIAGGTYQMRQLNSPLQANGASPSNASAATGSARASEPLALAAAAETLAREEAAAALRRAQLAEHIYDNKCGLGEDMKFLASLPELCDITFLVGETREPVCAVKCVLAARSRVFHKILFGNRVRAINNQRPTLDNSPIMAPANEQATLAEVAGQSGRRGSSPRPTHMSASAAGRTLASLAKSSLPSSRSTSPNQQQQQQQQQQQWSVISDASGYNATRPAAPARADSLVAASRSGRASVASNQRESISQASQGSQQPLIIGPGQTATPAPKQRHKKHRLGRLTSGETSGSSGGGGGGGAGSAPTAAFDSSHSPRNNRLSRMFTNKRASDPSIKHNQPLAGSISLGPAGLNHGAHAGQLADSTASSGGMMSANQSYLDKMSSSQKSTTMIIEEFEPDVFRQLIEYIHTGCVLLQARTLLGLLNAADYYGLEQLRKACLRFVSCCITVDTVCSLLSTAERYIQYKCTKSIVQKVLEFVDTHANEIFKLNAFGLLPEHVVRLILARDGLQADEHHKYNGVYTWCEHYCRSYELTNIADIMRNFLDLIQFHKIPTNVLLTEIYPTHVVPDEIFLSALAYQADVNASDEQSARPRRMTLPNTIVFKDYEDEDEDGNGNGNGNGNEDGNEDEGAENRRPADEKKVNYERRPSSSRRESSASSQQQQQQQQQPPRLLLGARKSTGGASSATPTASTKSVSPIEPASRKAHRKGSIAQVSISGVKRLSHKLSIRKRHSNMPASGGASAASAAENRRRGSSGASSGASSRAQQQQHRKSIISKQSSLAYSVASGSLMSGGGGASAAERDPIQVGRQILDAYLTAQRQRELEEEERRQREEADKRAAEEAKRRAAGLDAGSSEQPKLSAGQQQRALAKRPLVKTPSSTRKSFRDFKNISRRLFMRHSSSKTILQSQHSSASITSGHASFDRPAGESGSSSQRASSQLEKATSASIVQQQQQADKERRLLKIKRSETVFEATPSSGVNSRKR